MVKNTAEMFEKAVSCNCKTCKVVTLANPNPNPNYVDLCMS